MNSRAVFLPGIDTTASDFSAYAVAVDNEPVAIEVRETCQDDPVALLFEDLAAKRDVRRPGAIEIEGASRPGEQRDDYACHDASAKSAQQRHGPVLSLGDGHQKADGAGLAPALRPTRRRKGPAHAPWAGKPQK